MTAEAESLPTAPPVHERAFTHSGQQGAPAQRRPGRSRSAQLSSDGISLPEEEPFHHAPGKGCSESLSPGEDVTICDYSDWDSRTDRQVGPSPHKASFLSVDAILFVGELPARLLTPQCSRTEPLKWSVIMVHNKASKEGKERGKRSPMALRNEACEWREVVF